DRSGQGLLAHLTRLTDLNRVFKSGTLDKAKRKTTAKRALQYIGLFGRNADLDIQMAAFLDALKNSTFLDQLCANAYFDIRDSGTESLFKILAATHFHSGTVRINGEPKTIDDLYTLLMAMFRNILFNLYGDFAAVVLGHAATALTHALRDEQRR